MAPNMASYWKLPSGKFQTNELVLLSKHGKLLEVAPCFCVGGNFQLKSRRDEKAMNKALWEFSNTYRRFVTLRRFLGIIGITIKFLFRVLFNKIWGKRRNRVGSRGGIGTLVRLLIEELGPTFIKFGQILSTRSECPVLKLCDNVLYRTR